MRDSLRRTALLGLLMLAATGPVRAQEPAATAKAAATPIKVTVTISRYQGEKKLSSLPYVLSMTIDPAVRGGEAFGNRRIGTKVPIMTTTTPNGPGVPTPKVEYLDVGTSIDCFARLADEPGRFKLSITVDESSVYEPPSSRGVVDTGRPTLRSFRTTESVMLRDGQSAEASNTPDRMTGESVKVEVAVAVVK